MGYLSVSEFAERHNISERTVRNWCAEGKMDGAFLTGKTWNIPSDTALPLRKNARTKRMSPLLDRLRNEKESKLKGGIYHKTQIDLTYNSNHIEGSKLTHDQTRYIFETNTIGITEDIKLFYYRGLQNWPSVPGYLRDTCLTVQDNYKLTLDYFKIKY